MSVAVQSCGAPRSSLGCVALAEYRLDDLARDLGCQCPQHPRLSRARAARPAAPGRSFGVLRRLPPVAAARPSTSCCAGGSTPPTSRSSSRACVRARTWPTFWAFSAPSWGPRIRRRSPVESPKDMAPWRLDIDPESDEARRADRTTVWPRSIDGEVVLADRSIGEIVARSPEQLLYVRAILRVSESTRKTVDELAAEFVDALEECVDGAVRYATMCPERRQRSTN